MAGYKLSAAILNRTKSARKLADGQALFFRRNADGTLTAWQRVKADGRARDVKVATAHGEVTQDWCQSQDWLRAIREQAYTIKTTAPAVETPAAKPAMQFHELWTEFTRAVMGATKPLWRQNTFDKLDARMTNENGSRSPRLYFKKHIIYKACLFLRRRAIVPTKPNPASSMA